MAAGEGCFGKMWETSISWEMETAHFLSEKAENQRRQFKNPPILRVTRTWVESKPQ